jgi:hypothetical protein
MTRIQRSLNCVLLVGFFHFGLTSIVRAEETPHLQFVTEFIRQLGAIERVRAAAVKEMGDDKADKMASCVHSSTTFQLELRWQLAMLQGMQLNPPFDNLLRHLASIYQMEIDIHKRLVGICTEVLSGPKPGIDYGAMLAEVPQLRAYLENTEQSLLPAATLAFGTLIDQKPDASNHVNRLIITKVEREKLIGDLNREFGAKLDEKNPNYTVGAAEVLKAYLLKDWKSSDDPG